MPNFFMLGRRDPSAIEDAALAALLAGTERPGDLPAGLQPAADVVAALRAGPASDEFAGETAATAEFRARARVPESALRTRGQPRIRRRDFPGDTARRRPRRRPSVLTSLVSAKAVAAAAVAALTIGGVATAAYAGALPSPAQGIAHSLIGAPSAHKRPKSHPSPAHHRLRHHAARALCATGWHATPHASATPGADPAKSGKAAAPCWPAHRWPGRHARAGCWPMAWPGSQHPSRPHPSSTSGPVPVVHSSCPQLPAPAGKPLPHRLRPFPIGTHFPDPGKPSRPLGSPAPGSGT
jgi:hypothetical protein